MNIDDFIIKRPSLYHLTDQRNLSNILSRKKVLSTKSIVLRSDLDNKEAFLKTKRPHHKKLKIDDIEIFIRDQRPISPIALSKCLTHNWTCEDYINHLNERVFWWPTIDRLQRHFKRYENENPVIIKVDSESLLNINNNAEFSRLNSGATRANPYLGGIPPRRGPKTFRPAQYYNLGIASVAEVTFPDQCILPESIYISYSPDGPWQLGN